MLRPYEDERGSSAGTLQPRYRRVLSFGDVLDESIRLFRQHWVTCALVSAVSLIPPGLVLVWAGATGMVSRSVSLADLQSGRTGQTSLFDTQLAVTTTATTILSGLFYVLWTAAIIATTEAYLRGGQPGLSRIYRRVMRRFFVVLLSTLLFALGMSVMIAFGFVLFVVTIFGMLGSVISVVTLLFWWLRPGARKEWVKWLIIFCTPFGLPMYYSVRWSMYAAAAVLERLGPLAALRRSSELVQRQAFRVLAILAVSSLMVGVLLSAPAALIEIPFMVSSASRGQLGLNPAEAAISYAVSVVLHIVFGSIGPITYTLLFVDLRNRREGTDLAERLTQLEASPIAPDG
jgi:hypothetical protein